MIRFVSCLWLMLLTACGLLAEDEVDWWAALREQGIFSEDQIAQLEYAAGQQLAGDSSALRALFRSDDDMLANAAVVVYLSELPTDEAINGVEAMEDPDERLLLGQLIGLLMQGARGAEYVFANPDRFDPNVLNVMLTVATGESHTSPEEWRAWFAENPEGLRWDILADG